MNTPHTIKLPALAAFLVLNAIEQPGWANTSRDLNDAFSLMGLFDFVAEIKNPPPEVKKAPTQRLAFEADSVWCSVPVEIKLTDRQRDAARKCLSALRDKMLLPPGRATAAILTAFGLDTE